MYKDHVDLDDNERQGVADSMTQAAGECRRHINKMLFVLKYESTNRLCQEHDGNLLRLKFGKLVIGKNSSLFETILPF